MRKIEGKNTYKSDEILCYEKYDILLFSQSKCPLWKYDENFDGLS